MSDYMSTPEETAKQPDALAIVQQIAAAAGPERQAAAFNAIWSFWNFAHVFDDLMGTKKKAAMHQRTSS
jgi:hypothetical protein